MSATFYTGTNRVADAVATVTERLETLPPGTAIDLDRDMAITAQEHFAYQTAQSRAFAAGRLTQDEALMVYNALGESGSIDNGGWAAGTTCAVKVAVTLLMGQIL